jgi:mannose-6-phosphate isomerase-like protein (cupin superfamily)
MDADLQVGQIVWIPAETHWAENIGPTPIRAIVTELKEAAPAASGAAAPAPK